MKKTSILIAIIILFCCPNMLTAQVKINNSKCKNSVRFADIIICLPVVDGMFECYKKPLVKKYFDKLNPTGNPIFASYLKNSHFKHIDSLDVYSIEDYFIIYGLNKMKGVKIDNTALNTISNLMENGFIKENWDYIKKKIEDNSDYITLGRPVLVKSYTVNSKIKAFVLLSKIENENGEKIQIQIMNYIQIKERLISLSYYLDYYDDNSFKTAKAKNDYITLLLLEEND
jgi:hypothetical protein